MIPFGLREDRAASVAPSIHGFSTTGYDFASSRGEVVAMGDFNGDGFVDFVMGNVNTNFRTTTALTYMLSDGNGGYVVKPLGVSAVTSITQVGDFNNDGFLDIALFDAGYYQNGGHGNPPKLLLGDGTGAFTVSNALEQAVLHAPRNTYLGNYSDGDLHVKDVTAADIDRDGDLDFWIESTGGDNITDHFMINNGDGTFTVDPTRIARETISGEPSYTPTGPFWRYNTGELMDLNGDGYADLVLGQIRDNDYTHETQSSFVVYNDGHGYFPLANRVRLPLPDFYNGYTQVRAVTSADLNGDGRADLIISHTPNDQVTSAPVDLAFQGRFIQILIANGDGTFRDESAARVTMQNNWAHPTSNPYNAAGYLSMQDVDADGDLDIVMGKAGAPLTASAPLVLVNNGSGVFTQANFGFYADGGAFWGEQNVGGDFNGDGIFDLFHIDSGPGPNGQYESGTWPNDDTSTFYLQLGRYAAGPQGPGADSYQDGGPGADTLNGGATRDSIWGYGGNDVINGLDGDDSLMGLIGDDQLSGGIGNDVLLGNAGNDILLGGAGGDRLDGGTGSDLLFGESGNDVLIGGGHDASTPDYFYGGVGNDTYVVNSALTGAQDLVDEGEGNAALAGSAADVDTIISRGALFWDFYSVAEKLVIDRAAGGEIVGGKNVLMKTITGSAGNDIILTYGHSSRVDAGHGTDAISFGLLGLAESYDGVNTLVEKAGNGLDYLYDFESGVDKVDLTAFGYGLSGAQWKSFLVDVDNGSNDYCFLYLGTPGDYLVFVGTTASQLQASDFIG